MATPLDLMLPKITSKTLPGVATAQKWNDEREAFSPQLLHGKLVEYYTEADKATRGNLENLLISIVGLVHDPLTLSQLLML